MFAAINNFLREKIKYNAITIVQEEFTDPYYTVKKVERSTDVPYCSYWDNPFVIENQLPIDDENEDNKDNKDKNNDDNDVVDEDNVATSTVDFGDITVKSLYVNKKKKNIVAYLKKKYLNKKNENDKVDREKIKLMRHRLLISVPKPFKRTLSIEKEFVTDHHLFKSNLKKFSFFKEKKNIPTSHLYPDVDAFTETLLDFLDDRSDEFDFNKVYKNRYNAFYENDNIFKGIVYKDLEQVPVMTHKEQCRLDDVEDAHVMVVRFNRFYLKTCLKPKIKKHFMDVLEFPLFMLDKNCNILINEKYGQYVRYRDIKDKMNDYSSLNIVLSSKCDDYNDYNVKDFFFDSKNAPANMGLLYYVLFWVSFHGLGLNLDFQEYMLTRVKQTRCTLGLSTSSDFFPQIMVPLPNALFYSCYVSTVLFKNHPMYFYQERLKELNSYSCDMRFLLQKIFGEDFLDYYNKKVRNRSNEIKNYDTLDNDIKNLILESYKSDDFGYHYTKILPGSRLLQLNKIINFNINFDDYIHTYYEHVQFFFARSVSYNIKLSFIHDSTMRPRLQKRRYYDPDDAVCNIHKFIQGMMNPIVLSNGLIMKRNISKIKLSKFLDLYKAFQECVGSLRKFPNLNEFHIFVHKKFVNRNNKICLFPENFISLIDGVHKSYTSFLKNKKVTVPQFLHVIERTNDYKVRVKEEGFSKYVGSEIVKYLENIFVDD
ncbi:94 kDa protein [Spodoptera frugiperda multiple nucleopolyhedrovirus]|uniref:94 kDa protein n=1 Tax=Spodoptera frugiperda nuclear polyhedrosis virus TaxID=10455 RepID=A1YJ89_NPVSF|nr:94 kDa protein [Spodoptera frugiperda multiple nucleopolyhedrovirus]ABM45809.1 94 kDa protein [Spodoptera frugiperda multiple nucleopolyhedrovirus]